MSTQELTEQQREKLIHFFAYSETQCEPNQEDILERFEDQYRSWSNKDLIEFFEEIFAEEDKTMDEVIEELIGE